MADNQADRAVNDIAPPPESADKFILVIDDDSSVRAITARMLERLGYRVITAVDGRAGVERFRENAEQTLCALIDMTMPQMSGEATCQALQAIDPTVRLILMSGHAEEQLATELDHLKLAGILQKPFNLEQLRLLIARVVGAAG